MEMPSGKKIMMFIRRGAERLVASILREPRCHFAFVSGMGEKYCLPIAGRLLQRAFPDDEWVLEEQEGIPPVGRLPITRTRGSTSAAAPTAWRSR